MKSNKIVWKNIYYMLVYAIEELAFMDIDSIEVEGLEGIDDLLTAIMDKSVQLLNENNFLNDYTLEVKTSNKLKGRVLIQQSYQSGNIARGQITYVYNKLYIDNYYNQIIKASMNVLLQYGTLTSKSRKTLNRLIDQFESVTDIDSYEIDFQSLDYSDLPIWYKPAIITSKLIIDNLIGKDRSGEVILYSLDDETRLHYIFERFVRNFYIEEYRGGRTTQPIYNTETRNNVLDMLIENDSVALVIDTKWYNSKNVQANRVGNEREVWDYMTSYVENENGTDKQVCGVILYGQTEANLEVLNKIQIRKDKYYIYEKTINLDQDFDNIKNDLILLADAAMFNV